MISEKTSIFRTQSEDLASLSQSKKDQRIFLKTMAWSVSNFETDKYSVNYRLQPFRNEHSSGRKQIDHRMKPFFDRPFTTANFGSTKQTRFTADQSPPLDKGIQMQHGNKYSYTRAFPIRTRYLESWFMEFRFWEK